MSFSAFQCPQSKQPLVPAEVQLIEKVNQAIAAKRLLNVDGQAVDQAIEGGWLSTHTQRLYPIRDSIICLIVEQALDLSQWDDLETKTPA